MTDGTRQPDEYDPFVLYDAYPEAAPIFRWRPTPLEDIKNECIVVLDTNVLATPYTKISSKSLVEIGNAYSDLARENRLVVPGQVAREFAGVRAKKLTELESQLSDAKSKAVALQTGKYPLLESVEEYRELLTLEAEINSQVEKYKKALGRIMEDVRGWSWNDPVSHLYGRLFDESVVFDPEFDREEIMRDLAWRQQHKLPPGYKDSGKGDGGIGDLLIWHTMLKLGEEKQQSTVFVTNDRKADWWHRAGSKALYPRFELGDEFRRRSGGQSFYALAFSDFLDLYGVAKTVVEEVRREEAESLRAIPVNYFGHGMSLPDGRVLVVREGGNYGALKALEQTSAQRGASITYQWWYQPDGTATFDRPPVQSGQGKTWELGDHVPNNPPAPEPLWPVVKVGPIRLGWSMGGDGSGYVYLGPPWNSDDCEIALTDKSDVSNVDVSRLKFFGFHRGEV